MTWFKSDGGLHSHRKVLSLRRRTIKAPERMAVMGLWSLAGTWCSDNLTDGQVAAFVPDELGGTDELAAALVRVGLWHAVGQDGTSCAAVEGPVGSVFH